MKFDTNLSAIHGYLCGDGYVIKNPPEQKKKYYYIGFRNMNDKLLKDFQRKFNKKFKVNPIITNDGRCKIQSKSIFQELTNKYSYYSHEWKMPELTKENKKMWLRAFFDCEAWVENQEAKNRSIRLDCVNLNGLKQIQNSLKKNGINSTIKKTKRPIWRLNICGLDDIKKFEFTIGFLHPDKKTKLKNAINSYKDYNWKVPKKKEELLKFIKKLGRKNESRKEIRFFSIKKNNLNILKSRLNKYNINSKLLGPWKNNHDSSYYCLVLKDIDKRNVE